MALAPGLCWVAVDAGAGAGLLGYLVSHPWHDGLPPPLDAVLGALPPQPATWYLHDCAVDARAWGLGLAGALYERARDGALRAGLSRGALVAVGDAAGYWRRRGWEVEESPSPELAAKLSGYGEGAVFMRCLLQKG